MTPHDEPATGRGGPPLDALERLLRAAGARSPGDAERMRRVRESVHDAWRESVPQTVAWRRRTVVAFVAAAAVVTVAIAASLTRRTTAPAPPPPSANPAARLMAATGSIWSVTDSRTPLTIGSNAVIGSAFETDAGALATFVWFDGGELRMNERTVMRFTAARELSINRGAIYLDSGPRAGSLVVRTPVGTVRDVGTRFEVGMRDGSWRVRVRQGSVIYEGTARREAAAGFELTVDPAGRILEHESPPFGDDWSWVVRAAPPFHIEGQTLAAFLDWAARESGRRIEFSNDELRRSSSGTLLHGSIENLTVEEALDVVLPTCGLSNRIDSARVIISRPEEPTERLRQ